MHSVSIEIANTEHLGRHDITPGEVEQVFANETDDPDYNDSEGDYRWTSIGHTDTLRVLVGVDHARRGNPHGYGVGTESQNARAVLQHKRYGAMEAKIKLPKFATEAEEAKWWDDNRKRVEENLMAAIEGGETTRGNAQRLVKEARESKNITIRMAESDLTLARKQAEEKGLPYQTYIKSVPHRERVQRA